MSFALSEIILTTFIPNIIISNIPKYIPQKCPAMQNPRYSETTIGSLQDLGRVVREQRRGSGLRIDDAAALCGVSVDLLSRLENGHSGVGTARLLKVMDGLGLAMIVVDKSKLTGIPAVADPTDR